MVFSSHHLEEIVFLIHPQILLHSRFANQSVLGRNRGIEDAKSKKDEGEHVSTIFRDCHDYGLTNLWWNRILTSSHSSLSMESMVRCFSTVWLSGFGPSTSLEREAVCQFGHFTGWMIRVQDIDAPYSSMYKEGHHQWIQPSQGTQGPCQTN